MERDKERFCAAAWPRLVAAVSYHCGDVHVAEELVQEALVRACRHWSRVSGLSSPEGWTYRVAVNLATSRWRRQQAERRAFERHGPHEQERADLAGVALVAIRDNDEVARELRDIRKAVTVDGEHHPERDFHGLAGRLLLCIKSPSPRPLDEEGTPWVPSQQP